MGEMADLAIEYQANNMEEVYDYLNRMASENKIKNELSLDCDIYTMDGLIKTTKAIGEYFELKLTEVKFDFFNRSFEFTFGDVSTSISEVDLINDEKDPFKVIYIMVKSLKEHSN